ncbi:hypothetical protein BV25DRAFT_1921346 [Artomyces pyxidatus]|uniref:Uncharacterized protein n=1 Tax=Artomyces pyxidatus TaxID=48021 RepID=A0ACB8SIH0_9AGAM|nr:hypothetical protein BV25DRAFT_1921346 [Artomyces pyxidatus]
MLGLLPPELILDVLSSLSLQCLLSLSLVSRQWNSFVAANEETVYRQAAHLHDFIRSAYSSLQDALRERHGNPWRGAISWKDFCRRSVQLQRNWGGQGRAVARVLSSAGSDVHRIKVDEQERLCVTTHMHGGLTVSHLFPDVILWSLPQRYVRPYAHCEYGNGFLVFDRIGNSKEVWRLACDFHDDERPALCPPDAAQCRVSAVAAQRHCEYGGRGHFRPWALISFPETTLAYRFVYPTLLSANDSRAFLYDVRTGALVQTVEDVVRDEDDVNYVELSARHVFVCGSGEVRIFSRETGQRVMQIQSLIFVERVLAADIDSQQPQNAVVSPLPLVPIDAYDGAPYYPGEFIAVHVSSDGRDLVLLRRQGCVLFFQDFERYVDGDIESAALEVRLRSTLHLYLAFEHDRVCVAARKGLYIFTLDSARHSTSRAACDVNDPHPVSFPRISLCAVQPYKRHTWSPDLSCLQITDRRIFFTWNMRTRRVALQLYHGGDEDPPPRAVAMLQDDGHSVAESVPGAHGDVEQAFDMIAGLELNMPLQLIWGTADDTPVGCIDFSLMP